MPARCARGGRGREADRGARPEAQRGSYWTYLTSENRPYAPRCPRRDGRSRRRGEFSGLDRAGEVPALGGALDAFAAFGTHPPPHQAKPFRICNLAYGLPWLMLGRRDLVAGDRPTFLPALAQQPGLRLIDNERIVRGRSAPQEGFVAVLRPAGEHRRAREPVDRPARHRRAKVFLVLSPVVGDVGQRVPRLPRRDRKS